MIEFQHNFFSSDEYCHVRPLIQKEIRQILGIGDSFLMEVAINEAVNNALKFNQSHKPILLSIKVTPNFRLIVRIKDHGKGFDANETLQEISCSPDLFFEDRLYAESGRGLSIMKCATDRIIFNRKGNEILLMKYIKQNSREALDTYQVEVCK